MDQQQLANMLAYKNENVISRFMDMYDVTEEEAEDLFIETRKFMYLAQLPGILITDDLLIIDEMWHNFILFTKEYNDFCFNHFKKFQHHLPATKEEKEINKKLILENPEKAKENFLKSASKLVELTYDHLGEETVVKWFQIYPDKYSIDKIKELRK